MSGGDRPFMVSNYAEADHTLGQRGRRGTYGRPTPKSDVDPLSPLAGRIVSIHRPSLPYTQATEQGSTSHFGNSAPQTGKYGDFHTHTHLGDDSANSTKFQRSRQQEYGGYSQGFGTQTDGSLHYYSQHNSVQVRAQQCAVTSTAMSICIPVSMMLTIVPH